MPEAVRCVRCMEWLGPEGNISPVAGKALCRECLKGMSGHAVGYFLRDVSTDNFSEFVHCFNVLMDERKRLRKIKIRKGE